MAALTVLEFQGSFRHNPAVTGLRKGQAETLSNQPNDVHVTVRTWHGPQRSVRKKILPYNHFFLVIFFLLVSALIVLKTIDEGPLVRKDCDVRLKARIW